MVDRQREEQLLMLNIDAEKAALEPRWFTVHDAHGEMPAVEVRFVPIGRIAYRAARRAAGECYVGADLPEEEGAPLPPELIESAGDAMSECLLMLGIDAWRGVGDKDGNVASVTPENLKAFLADPVRFDKLDADYVRPFMLKELEKNGLAPSPTGTSARAAEPTAGTSATPDATADAPLIPAAQPTLPGADAPTTLTSPAPKAD
jgi:hypothetical protein